MTSGYKSCDDLLRPTSKAYCDDDAGSVVGEELTAVVHRAVTLKTH